MHLDLKSATVAATVATDNAPYLGASICKESSAPCLDSGALASDTLALLLLLVDGQPQERAIQVSLKEDIMTSSAEMNTEE
jgi:hypothetical protein